MINKVCVYCGRPFNTSHPNQKTCSKECGHNENLRLKRQRWAEAFVPTTRICKECGTIFQTQCGNKHRVYCCDACALKAERRQEHSSTRHKVYMRSQKNIRDKQIARAFVEEVPFEVVYARDGGICKICGLPVHPMKGIDNSWDGTIDHIIPLSVGGEHSLANCQLAHRICNSIKCQASVEFKLDWEKKANENNYWRSKYQRYFELMRETPRGGQNPENELF